MIFLIFFKINKEMRKINGIDINGNILPSATYYYVISVEEVNQFIKGTLTIVR